MDNITTKKIHKSFIHISKRPELPLKKVIIYYAVAVVLALIVCGLFVLIIGVNPFYFFGTMISGCFRSELAFVSTIKIVLPLLITSLGLCLSFKMKFWNIGGEGQFIMGAVFASFFALYCNSMPHFLLMIVMFLAGAVGGGLFGLIAAFFKCKFGTNETLLTLMLNYIALYIIQYLRDGPWRDPNGSGFQRIAKFPEVAWLDQVLGIDVTWVIAIILLVAVFIYLKYTKHGYEISVVGDSKNTARYAGMNVDLIVMRTMFISAALCGIAGMLQVSGDATSHTLDMDIAGGIGFTAIIVAWLAKLNPIGIFIVSCLFGILEKGASVAGSKFDLSSSVSDVVQGIFLFIVLGTEFFMRYKVCLNHTKTSDGGVVK